MPVREVDDPDDAEYQRQTDAQQRIDAAQQDATDEQLLEDIHWVRLAFCRGSVSGAAPISCDFPMRAAASDWAAAQRA